MQKLVYIISDTCKSFQFEWIAEGIDKKKFTQYYILLNNCDSELEQFLIHKGFYVKRINASNLMMQISCFIKLIILFLKIKPTIVHYHLYKASFLGCLVAFFVRVPIRVFTRHHASYNREYYPKAVKKDKLINYLSTHIIAISENVKNELVTHENVSLSKIFLIHHGLNFDVIDAVEKKQVDYLKGKYHITAKAPVIGVISRYIHLKGIEYIIQAFKKLQEEFPNAQLVLANAFGNYAKEIKHLLKTSLPKHSYIEVPFENNLFALYNTFDVFIHVPINNECEAFGQIYTEALACGIPSIFTLSGVATEFIEDKKNALVVPFKNSNAIYDALKNILLNNFLRETLIVNGRKSVEDNFNITKTIHQLEEVYQHV